MRPVPHGTEETPGGSRGRRERGLRRMIARSSHSVARKSTPRELPLDKQKGVQGAQFTSEAFTGVHRDQYGWQGRVARQCLCRAHLEIG
jgi:hypothetical protein